MTTENQTVDVRAIEQMVNEARKSGDPHRLLAIAGEAMDTLEAAAETGEQSPGEYRKQALNAASRIGYNAAADAWPGWAIDTPAPCEADLEAAQALAQRSQVLVDRLGLSTVRRGNASWLIGAFHLARGKRREAIAAFREAVEFYAEAPAARLLNEGYIVIASELPGPPAREPSAEFAGVLASLAALATDEATEFQSQLRIARQVFNHP